MGSSLSVDVGFGIVLPWGEDSVFDFEEPFYEQFFDPSDEFTRPDTYEIEAHIERKFPLLKVEVGYWHDYGLDTLLLVASTHHNGYDGATVSFTPSMPVNTELMALLDAATLLGVPYEPSWLAQASYG